MDKLHLRIQAQSANLEQAQSFLSQSRKLMEQALADDLASEAGLNQVIATFEELRRRSERVLELRRTLELLRSIEE